MATLDLITRQDLEQFKTELFSELKKMQGLPAVSPAKEWLRSMDVRKLLNISAGTLQNLRISGTLPYTRVGSIMYYRYADILKILDGGRS